MSELRRDREWDHWPQDRRPEEGIRRKLRDLFHPTLGDEEVEQALAVHSHELEQRAAELADTVADLERREGQTRELRSAVEQMLRRGSAELDERHAELSELAGTLGDREATLAENESALAERRRELGAVELRRAAVERREETLTDRERELTRREEELTARESALADLEAHAREVDERAAQTERRAAELEALQGRVEDTLSVVEREQAVLGAREAALLERERAHEETQQERERELEERNRGLDDRERALRGLEDREQALHTSAEELRERELTVASDLAAVAEQREGLLQAVVSVTRDLGLPADVEPETAPGTTGDREYVAVVLREGRYAIVTRDDGPPALGMELDVDGAVFRVVRLAGSPLPDDRRRCAFTEPVRAPAPL
jgi:DNA repair exonuclease SbcCD ATPase subunit